MTGTQKKWTILLMKYEKGVEEVAFAFWCALLSFFSLPCSARHPAFSLRLFIAHI